MGKGSKRRPEAENGSFDKNYDRMVKEGGLKPPPKPYEVTEPQSDQQSD